MILATRFTFIVERNWKNHVLSVKNGLTTCYILMTSYLVTIETDHHWTCLKMCARYKQTATENVTWWRFILYEKNKENLTEGYVWGLIRANSTRYRRVQGSNPVQALIFFRLSFRNCKSCVYNCDDRLSYNSLPRSSHIWFSCIHKSIETKQL